MPHRAPYRFRPRVHELDQVPRGDDLLCALADRCDLAVLDSAGGQPSAFSLFAFDPLQGADLGAPRSIAGLRSYVGLLGRSGGDDLPGHFHGGFIGALSYDMGPAGEALNLPKDPWGTPPLIGALYTDFILIDHGQHRAWLVLGEEPGDGRPTVEERRAQILDLIATPPRRHGDARASGELIRHVPGALHRSRIERVREHIAAGEIYQANLAHRFTRAMEGAPLDLYRRLRRVNPAPYMTYLRWADGALLSASPELLLQCADGRARTRPIKGTVQRGMTPLADRAAREGLLASGKDIAELAMIVDLERNDLGRVCLPGTVRVPQFPRLESYTAVHHLVADVEGELRPDVDALDALAALFPGGSITGAPKLRSMEVIAEQEEQGRGFFTGSAGFIDLEGHALFNILIRSLVWRPQPGASQDADEARPVRGEVSFHVGGGITFQSDAEAEERETLYKGAALAAALCAEDQELDTLGVEVPGLSRLSVSESAS